MQWGNNLLPMLVVWVRHGDHQHVRRFHITLTYVLSFLAIRQIRYTYTTFYVLLMTSCGTRIPIERMELVDNFGANDDASMAANNTSAFNCRFVEGTTRWSEHVYGRAIYINTVQNPYVDARHVSPPNGAPHANRYP